MPEVQPSHRFQFSLAWLIFCTVVCASVTAVARQLVLRGDDGIGYLVLFGAVAIWLSVFGLAAYRRVFNARRWQKAREKRAAMQALVRDYREHEREGK